MRDSTIDSTVTVSSRPSVTCADLLLPDSDAEVRGLVRVVDESGEDYLYPAKNFHKVELPAAVRRAVFHAA